MLQNSTHERATQYVEWYWVRFTWKFWESEQQTPCMKWFKMKHVNSNTGGRLEAKMLQDARKNWSL